MIIYISAFLASLLLIYIGINSKIKFFNKLLILFGLLIPCILAGLRDTSVGTDTEGYVYILYNAAGKYKPFSLFVYIAKAWYDQSDYGYLLLQYISKNYLNSFGLFLFISECLVIFPIYKAAYLTSNGNSRSIITTIFIFFFYFYNSTLNMARQAIAIAFVVLSFSYFINENVDRRYAKSILCLIIGILFHKTAIIGLALIILYQLTITRTISKYSKQILYGLIILFSIIIIIFHNSILQLIASLGIYSHAISFTKAYGGQINFNITKAFIDIYIIAYIQENKNKYLSTNKNYNFGKLVSILNIIFSLVGTFITYSDRIALYGFYILVVNYISPVYTLKRKTTVSNFLVLVFIAWWIYNIGIRNVNGTIPYILASY